MDLHGMKRKDLRTLCKKYGIPRNLKNSEMSRRLELVFEETNKLPAEDSVEAAYGIKEKNVVVVSGETKKVSFSPEIEVFEFTRSLKKCKRNKVQKRQQGGIAQKGTRRSERIGCKLAGVMGVKRFVDEGDISKRLSENKSVVTKITNHGFKLENVRRRSTRLAKSCVGGGEISKTGLFSCAKRSKQLVDTKDKEDELFDDPQVKKVPRRSKRFLNTTTDVETNTQAQRRSTRLKARAAKPSMGGGASDYQKY